MSLLIGTLVAVGVIALVYAHIGFSTLLACYGNWFKRDYWTSYNLVELISWIAKAIIIVPGLLFGKQWPWLYAVALVTSISLIWASNKKTLPTLVAFNTLWIWLGVVALFNAYG